MSAGRAGALPAAVVQGDPGGRGQRLLNVGAVGKARRRDGGDRDQGHRGRPLGRQRVHEAAVLTTVPAGKVLANPDQPGEGGHAQRLQHAHGLGNVAVGGRVVAEAGVQRVISGKPCGLPHHRQRPGDALGLSLAVEAGQVIVQQHPSSWSLRQEVPDRLSGWAAANPGVG